MLKSHSQHSNPDDMVSFYNKLKVDPIWKHLQWVLISSLDRVQYNKEIQIEITFSRDVLQQKGKKFLLPRYVESS